MPVAEGVASPAGCWAEVRDSAHQVAGPSAAVVAAGAGSAA